MTHFRLLLRNLLYHARTNTAVVLGVIAATAVITGALIVGDSVRGSLREMSLERLQKIDDVLIAPRFVREDLARELAAQPVFKERFDTAAPALMLSAPFVAEHGGISRRAGGVQIFGGDERLWQLINIKPPYLTGDEMAINERLAERLRVHAGDDVSLLIEVPSAIPRESLLGKREGDFREIQFKIKAVLPDDSGSARLTLNPTQQLPLNAFVPLGKLQRSVDLARVERSRRNPQGSEAQINALFVSAKSPRDQTGASAPEAARSLSDELSGLLVPADLGLRIAVDSPRGYVSVESEQQILDSDMAAAVTESAKRLGLTTSPVLVYLANELTNVNDPKKFSMYSVVAGLDPVTATNPPFGPFVWASPVPSHPLGPDEIVLNDWIAQDLAAKPNDDVRLRYHIIGSHGELPEVEHTFRVAGILKLEGPAADPGLVPVVKGITDAKTINDWKQPFPMKLDRVTPRDDRYWDEHRATPKSFVSLETAQKLWGSRFGSLTSVRVASKAGQTVEQTAADMRRELLKSLKPAQTHLQFQPVKYTGVQAAAGSNDFSELFLGFSFFLILAATFLIGLIFRLGIERRGTTIGLLAAVGFTPRRLRWLFLEEGLILVAVGGLLGTVVAVGFAELMVYGLTHWWTQAVGTQSLSVFIVPSTLAMGFVFSAIVTALAVLWGLRQLKALSPRELLSGATEPAISAVRQRRRSRRSLAIGTALLVLAGVLLLGVLTGRLQGEAFEGLSWGVVLFFLDGVIILVGGVMLIAGLLDGEHSAAVRGHGLTGLARLGVRNTARQRQRSTASVSLVAAATFVIVAVAAGRRNPAAEAPDKNSGNGGFRLVAESSEPILPDLNTSAGRTALGMKLKPGSPDETLIKDSRFFAFRVKPGEDASCLNIYQTRLPTILGVPKSFIERGGFRFIGRSEPNPWTLLEQTEPDGSIPVIGDANTLQYSLHKEVGTTIAVPDEEHPQHTLKIVGMLDGSVFQGVLLMSDDNFRKAYPNVEGYKYFLIESPGSAAEADHLSDVLETQLTQFGFDAERVSDRLANFLAVQNTYLSTFQTLGGLGLLLGTLGLATVMVRNVLERRKELALLNALGLRPSGLAWLVLVETAVLLLCGLATGTIAAFVAMVPHLASTGADVPWGSLALILAVVFFVGMLGALLASIEAARTRILEALRSE
ncbi:MAG TPA: ABC transporter permease [Planctomycetaceae bacterium]|jgi:ABC-type antimicrobial peptide transport system permease subunit|nr:ABC transporter permease [Planctomycetaceae bacterium]